MDVMGALLCFLALGHSASPLQLTGPSIHAAWLGSTTLVPCRFTVDNPPVDPEHLTIFWFFQDNEILSYDKTVRTISSRYSLNTEILVAGIANLTISNIQIPDGGMYKCSVSYSSERKEKEVRLDIGAPPQVRITGNTVVMNEESVLRCSITGFYPVDIDIRWFRNGERLKDNVGGGEPQRNPDRTYKVTSTLTITPTEEDRERNFSCRVHHEYLQEPLQEDFRLVYEDRRLVVIIAVCCAIGLVVMSLIGAILWWKLKPRKKAKGPFMAKDIKGSLKPIDGEEATRYCPVDNYPENLCVMKRDGEIQEIQTSQVKGESKEEKKSLLYSSDVKRSQEGHQNSRSMSGIRSKERHRDETINRGVCNQQSDEKTFPCKTAGKTKGETTDNLSHTESPPDSPNRTLNISSEVTVPEDQYKYTGFRSQEHKSMEKTKSRKPSIRDSGKTNGETTDNLSHTESPPDNRNRTLNISSEVTVPEDPEFRYRKNEFMDKPKYRDLDEKVRNPKDHQKNPGFRSQEHKSTENTISREPSIRDSGTLCDLEIGEIKVPKLILGGNARLECPLSNYKPDVHSVKWFQERQDKDKPITVNSDGRRKISTEKYGAGTYKSYLDLITVTEEDLGKRYICRVGPSNSGQEKEKKTGFLFVHATSRFQKH